MIELSEFIEPERIILFERSMTKHEVLERLIDRLAATSVIQNPEEFRKEIWDRETLLSTGIGMGIGIPHIKSACVRSMIMAMAICRTPIADYESLDGQPVHFAVMIAAPADAHRLYLQGLAKVALILKSEKKRQALLSVGTAEQVLEILSY